MARKQAKKPQVLRYAGKGDYLPGVPARDLSVQEFEALPETIQQQCLDLGLYVREDVPDPQPEE